MYIGSHTTIVYGVYTSTGFKDQSLRCTFHSVKDSVYVHTCTHKLNKTKYYYYVGTEETVGIEETLVTEGTLGTVL